MDERDFLKNQTIQKAILFRDSGGGGEIRSKDCVSIPWSRPPIVQVENLFGVEQIVEFPKNYMEKKERERERERPRQRRGMSL